MRKFNLGKRVRAFGFDKNGLLLSGKNNKGVRAVIVSS